MSWARPGHVSGIGQLQVNFNNKQKHLTNHTLKQDTHNEKFKTDNRSWSPNKIKTKMPKILQMQTNSDVIFKEFQKMLICRCIIGEVFRSLNTLPVLQLR